MRKILLVGLGGMGRVHLANYAHLKEKAAILATVGSCDSDQKTAEEYSLPYFTSIEEAANAIPEIDTVDITTPSFCHKEHIHASLRANKDVICEKPLTLNVQDAEEVYALAKEKNRKLLPAHVCRYTKEFTALKDIVDKGIYGKVLAGEFTRLSPTPAWSKGSWLFDKEKSGLIPFDLHIHDLDMITALFGKAKRVESFSSRASQLSYDNYYRVNYFFDDFLIMAQAGWLDSSLPFTATFRLIFETATVVYNGENIKVYPKDEGPFKMDISYPVVVASGINVPPSGWYYEELSLLLDCLEDKSARAASEEEILYELETLSKM